MNKWEIKLLETVEKLHNGLHGSGLQVDEMDKLAKKLTYRLYMWDFSEQSLYDRAVRNLVQQVLIDYDVFVLTLTL